MNTCECVCVCIKRTCKQADIARAMRCERRAAEVIKRERAKKGSLEMGEFSVKAIFEGGEFVGSNLLQVSETSSRQDIASSDLT